MSRTENVHAQVAALVVPYARMYGTLTPEIQALHASPERLHAAVAANVTKTGPIKFRKGDLPHTPENADAVLWRRCHDHARPGGEYLPIDGLMSVRWTYGAEAYDLWTSTVELVKKAQSA